MIPILPVAAAVLAILAAQATGSGSRRTGDEAPPPAEEVEETPPPIPESPPVDPIAGQSGIPFMPTVGTPPAAVQGVFLDAAVLSQVRVRTLSVTDASTTWGTDVEVTPGIALEVVSPQFDLSLGYAPRLTVPLDVGSFELAVLNRATTIVTWRVDPLWTVSASGIFVVGDNSQLLPASTPGGAGPPPPVINPVRSFQTYPYVGIDAVVRVETLLSRVARLRLAGGYFDVGGTGTEGAAIQPRTWGPQGEATFALDVSRTATLTTIAAGQDWMMVGDFGVLIGTLSEAWRQSISSEFDLTLSAGAGFSNREVESRTAANKVFPVAGLRLDYHPDVRDMLRLSLDAALAPYVDVYLRIPYQRLTTTIAFDWSPSDAWRLGATLAAALVPSSVRAPESYGTAGASASYAPVRFVILTAGAFSQVQFQGQDLGAGMFRQWTMYLSLTLRDRLGL